MSDQPDRPAQDSAPDSAQPSAEPVEVPPVEPASQDPAAPAQPSFGRWMGSMWLYTTLRFALFFALWGILVLIGLRPLFAALLGLVLSVPLSFVLLAKPRAAFTMNLEARVDARREKRSDLDHELDPSADDEQ